MPATSLAFGNHHTIEEQAGAFHCLPQVKITNIGNSYIFSDFLIIVFKRYMDILGWNM